MSNYDSVTYWQQYYWAFCKPSSDYTLWIHSAIRGVPISCFQNISIRDIFLSYIAIFMIFMIHSGYTLNVRHVSLVGLCEGPCIIAHQLYRGPWLVRMRLVRHDDKSSTSHPPSSPIMPSLFHVLFSLSLSPSLFLCQPTVSALRTLACYVAIAQGKI